MPIRIAGIDHQAGGAARFKHFTGAETGGAERRVVRPHQSLEPAVDDAIGDVAAHVLLTESQRVTLVQPRAVAAHGHTFGQRRIDEHVGLPGAVTAHQFNLQVVQRVDVGKAVADRAL